MNSHFSPENLQDAAAAAACAAGRHALQEYDRRGEIETALDHDLKLVLDRECQVIAETSLLTRFPDHAILGEEGCRSVERAEVEWIIDPIDGTVNFSSGMPHWCSSVAARMGGRIVAGAVYAPQHGELYAACIDGPATCNGQELRPAPAGSLREAMVMTSLAAEKGPDAPERKLLYDLSCKARKIRLLGSAAMDICFAASGRGHAYLETCIHLWDVAAAALIAEGAGLNILLREIPGEGHRLHGLCAVPGAFEELEALYRSHFP